MSKSCVKCQEGYEEKDLIKNDHLILCIDCLSDGWQVCDYSKELFNRNNVNSEEFKLVYDLGLLAPSHESSNRFASNKNYNLYHIEGEILNLKNGVLTEKALGYDEWFKRKQATTNVVDDRINYLNSIKAQFNE